MKSKLTTIFIAAESAIFVIYTVSDALSLFNTAALKYSGMLLCLGYSAYPSTQGGERLVTAAIFLAALADIPLLLLDIAYAVGVLLFCCVQALYFVRIRRANGGRSAALWRILLPAAALAGLWALGILTPLNALCAVYFTFFMCNAVQSFDMKNRLFSIGLCLFLCCDICVGLHNLPLGETKLARAVALGMWTFYLPSQVLICLSGGKRDE